MTNLDTKALEAAREAFLQAGGADAEPFQLACRVAIEAYLAALPSRSSILEEAARVADAIKERGQIDYASAPKAYLEGHDVACFDITAAIRSLKGEW